MSSARGALDADTARLAEGRVGLAAVGTGGGVRLAAGETRGAWLAARGTMGVRLSAGGDRGAGLTAGTGEGVRLAPGGTRGIRLSAGGDRGAKLTAVGTGGVRMAAGGDRGAWLAAGMGQAGCREVLPGSSWLEPAVIFAETFTLNIRYSTRITHKWLSTYSVTFKNYYVNFAGHLHMKTYFAQTLSSVATHSHFEWKQAV